MAHAALIGDHSRSLVPVELLCDLSHRITGIKRGLRCRRNNNEFRPVNFKVQAL
jgi:hypothetical protein